MRISVLRFNGQLEIPGMAACSRFRITEAEGFAMTVTPLGILARHERRELDVLIPWVRIDSADVLPEPAEQYSSQGSMGMLGSHLSPEQAQMAASTQQPPPKRGPGRPPKAVA